MSQLKQFSAPRLSSVALPAQPWIIPAAIGLGSLLVTLVLWQVTLFQSHQSDQIRFDRLSDSVQQTIQQRLEQNERALIGLKGLYAASKSVERGEFREYAKSLNLAAYHGALGFGFIHYVPRENLDKFLAQTQADEAPDFSLRLTSTQPDLFIIEYIEPLAANLPAQGFDIGTETVRREAATRAVEENKIILSRRSTLVQDKNKLPGFILLLPIYANRAVTSTPADRWRALTGWVYCPIRIDSLMADIGEQTTQQIDFEVFEDDGTLRSAILFDADGHLRDSHHERVTEADFHSRKFNKQREINFAGRHWLLHTSTRPEFDRGTEQRLPWFVLLGGLFGSALFTYAASTSYRARREAVKLAATMTLELREEITQREQTARALRELSNFQEAIVLSADYAIVSTTPEGVIRVFNPAAQRMLGYTEAELIGHQTPAIWHLPEEVVARAQELSTELGCPVAPGFDVLIIKSCRGLPNEHEWTYVRKDGSRLPVMLSVTAIRDDQGGFAGFLGIAIDLTQRKRVWEELLESRHASDAALHEVLLQRDALDQHAIVSITDPQGKIQLANNHFCTISGYTHKELIGQPHRIINSGYHPPAFWNNFWKTIGAGNVWHGEICNRAKNGSHYWVDATVVPFHDAQGEINRFVAIRTDITARKNAERELLEVRKVAETANKSQSELLAGMSHEIHIPMNAVLGFTTLLATTPLSEKQRSFVESIQLSGQNLLTIINDILDYSKIEAGKLEVERREVDATQTIIIVVKTLSLQAEKKSLTLSHHYLPGTPPLITADPTRVRQVLIKLVGNALKFTQHGGVTLATESVIVAGLPHLRFNVTDTGIGLSPAQQAKLFSKFTRAKASTTREFGGTGLGLAISQRLVELMGGEIGVISKESQGSTFWFTLPLATGAGVAASGPACHDAVVAPITPTPPTDPEACGYANSKLAPPPLPWQVLVADDNSINTQLAGAFLAKLNCVTTVANNGAEAAKLAQEKSFDLVLMDYQMPVMDGMQATTAIRQWEAAQPRPNRLPIIAVTANLNFEMADNFLACGMDGSLGKPLMFSELKETIGNLIPRNSGTTVSEVAAGVAAGCDSGVDPAAVAPPTGPEACGYTKSISAAMNRERALQLTDNNPMLLGILAQTFLAQCDGLMTSIHQALQAHDEAALRAHAHKLKGSLSVFAADQAFAPVLALNKFPGPPDWAELDRLGQVLEKELTRLRPELAALTATAVASAP